MNGHNTVSIRQACAADAPVIKRFLHQLAAHDGHADQCHITEADIHKFAFSEEQCVEVILIEVGKKPQGLALFFMTFSVWQGGA